MEESKIQFSSRPQKNERAEEVTLTPNLIFRSPGFSHDPVLFLLISVVLLLAPQLLMQELSLATRVIKVSF